MDGLGERNCTVGLRKKELRSNVQEFFEEKPGKWLYNEKDCPVFKKIGTAEFCERVQTRSMSWWERLKTVVYQEELINISTLFE